MRYIIALVLVQLVLIIGYCLLSLSLLLLLSLFVKLALFDKFLHGGDPPPHLSKPNSCTILHLTFQTNTKPNV